MVLKFGTSGYLGNVSLEATTNYSCLRRTLFQIERVFLISILTFLFVMVGKKSATLPPRHEGVVIVCFQGVLDLPGKLV